MGKRILAAQRRKAMEERRWTGGRPLHYDQVAFYASKFSLRSAKDDKRVSERAARDRVERIAGFFEDLKALGFRVKDARNVSQKHIRAVVQAREAAGLSGLAVQAMLSSLTHFLECMFQNGQMVRSIDFYSKDPSYGSRSAASAKARAEAGTGLDELGFSNLVDEIRRDLPRAATSIELERWLELSHREALILAPHESDKGDRLIVMKGTRNQSPRMIPIVTERQREILERAKSLCQPGEGVIGPRGQVDYANAAQAYAEALAKYGITGEGRAITARGTPQTKGGLGSESDAKAPPPENPDGQLSLPLSGGKLKRRTTRPPRKATSNANRRMASRKPSRASPRSTKSRVQDLAAGNARAPIRAGIVDGGHRPENETDPAMPVSAVDLKTDSEA